MKTMVLGVGDIGASDKMGAGIKTYALGSCVALIIYDIKEKVAGMAHIALPDSNIRKSIADKRPGYFADIAVRRLLQSMARLRGNKKKGLVVKLAGGASIMDAEGTFSIGSQNIKAVLTLLSGFGLTPMSRDVGGQISRTVTIDVDSGKVVLSSPGRKNWEI